MLKTKKILVEKNLRCWSSDFEVIQTAPRERLGSQGEAKREPQREVGGEKRHSNFVYLRFARGRFL